MKNNRLFIETTLQEINRQQQMEELLNQALNEVQRLKENQEVEVKLEVYFNSGAAKNHLKEKSKSVTFTCSENDIGNKIKSQLHIQLMVMDSLSDEIQHLNRQLERIPNWVKRLFNWL